MGAMAEAIAAYAQPLIDQTDGSSEMMNRALALAQVCWNLALVPAVERDEAIREMQPTLKMNDREFEDFRDTFLILMIQRHEEMFPQLHKHGTTESPIGTFASQVSVIAPRNSETYPGTGRNAPCPCSSGRKYKRCCGR
jgi:uncharacterized protein YecA (UPF0149 family)